MAARMMIMKTITINYKRLRCKEFGRRSDSNLTLATESLVTCRQASSKTK